MEQEVKEDLKCSYQEKRRNADLRKTAMASL
jgi:hypothetical protein